MSTRNILLVTAVTLCVGGVHLIEAQSEPIFSGDIDIFGDDVRPQADFAAKFTVLGAEITYGGYYDIPVTVQIRIGDLTIEPYGSFDNPLAGDVNDGGATEHEFIQTEPLDANTPIRVLARSWVKKSFGYSGTQQWHWKEHMLAYAPLDSEQVIVLRNGDPVPDIPAFQDQAGIHALVRDFIDPATDTMRLYTDEVIYLFELGTTDTSGPDADFQDLVILVTLADDPNDLSDQEPRIRSTLTVFD